MFDLNKKDSARPAADSSPVTSASTSHASAPTRSAAATSMAVIGGSIQIKGDLLGDEDIRIEGDIEGNIHIPNHSLTIGQQGRVRADAYAKAVIIDGEINGDVYGSESVAIRSNARVTGNVLAPRVSIEEGARFKGSIDMDADTVNSALAKVERPESARSKSKANGANGASAAARPASEALQNGADTAG